MVDIFTKLAKLVASRKLLLASGGVVAAGGLTAGVPAVVFSYLDERIKQYQDIISSLESNQFVIFDNENGDEWLKHNVPGTYRTYRFKDSGYPWYNIIDFGDNTEAAALFKLFNL